MQILKVFKSDDSQQFYIEGVTFGNVEDFTYIRNGDFFGIKRINTSVGEVRNKKYDSFADKDGNLFADADALEAYFISQFFVKPLATVDDIADVAISNDYNDLNNLPTIPPAVTNTSDLINDGQSGTDAYVESGDVTALLTPINNSINDIENGINALQAQDTAFANEQSVQDVLIAGNTAKVSADGSIDTHSDVDTNTVSPNVNDVLSWDGSNWVPLTVSVGSSPWEASGANDIKYEAGSVGIGTDPDAFCQLHIKDDTGKGVCIEQIGIAGSAFLNLRKARGIIGAEAAVLGGDKLAGYDVGAFNGINYFNTADTSYWATENHGIGAGGSEIRFGTTANGTAFRVTRMAIRNNGDIDAFLNNIVQLGDPNNDTDAANKRYVDSRQHTMTVLGNGTILGQQGSFPMSVSRTGTGRYEITFNTAFPDDNYAIMISNREARTTRDDIRAVYDSRANTGFFVWIGEQDNGGTAGVFRDREFNVQIVKY